MTQEFHISVTPVGANEFLVRTERVSPGVPLAEEQVSWSVENWLNQARQLMGDPLLGLLQRDGNGESGLGSASQLLNLAGQVEAQGLVGLGRSLYDALFQGTIRDSWMTARGIAQNRREFLRLRLGLKGDLLPRLPWEVLHGGDRPLATGTDVVFSRYQSSFTPMVFPLRTQPAALLEPSKPLKILMVIAAPTDQEVLQLKREALQLQEELQGSLFNGNGDGGGIVYDPTIRSHQGGKAPEIQLTILDQPGRAILTQALEQGQYNVLHYAGHSNLGAAGGSLYLVNNRTGLTEELSGDDLAGLLVNNGIHMAVFNSCRGGYTATADPNDINQAGNLAAALIRQGIPAVLAMAEQIPDEVALTLSRLFYRNLKQGYPLDLSLSRARQGLISAYGSHQPYWALPILYLHPEFDGYLQSLANLDGNGHHGAIAESPLLIEPALFPNLVAQPTPPSTNGSRNPGSAPVAQPPAEQAVAAKTADDPIDLAKLIEKIEDQNPSREEDAMVVSELIRQLSVLEEEEPFLPAFDGESLLPASEAQAELDLYAELADPPQQESPLLAFPHRNASRNPPPTRPASGGGEMPVRDRAKFNGAIPTRSGITRSPVQSGGDRTSSKLVPVQAAPITPTTPSQPFPPPDPPKSFRPRRWLAIAGLGLAGTISVAGLWLTGLPQSWFPGGKTPPAPSPKPTAPVSSRKVKLSPNPNFKKADTKTVAAIAINGFSQGDLPTAQKAVTALLDRNALPEAQAALAAVPPAQTDVPEISFLRGRVSWQGIKAKDSTYSINDVLRSWEAASGKQASPRYLSALGFAYYSEGKLDEASQAWKGALESIAKQPSSPDLKQEELRASAGQALVLMQKARTQSPDQQAPLLKEAIGLRQKVLTTDPVNFQPEALASQWLWNEQAIADWRALLKESDR